MAKCDDGVYRSGEYASRTLGFRLLDDLTVKNGIVTAEIAIEGPWRINQDVLDKTLFVSRNFGMRRTLLAEERGQARLLNDLLDDQSCYNEKGSEDLSGLIGKVFSNPKPIGLATFLLDAAGVSRNDVVLDFFAGSGTVGQAVMEKNCADDGRRRYIPVQLPESFGQASRNSRAASELCDRLKRPHNIAEVTKERLRCAAARVKEDHPLFTGDLGFRVFKLDSSNIRFWEPNRRDLETTLLDNVDHIKSNRTSEDLLYELLLKLGLDLCIPIDVRSIAGHTVRSVGAGTLIACLAESFASDEVEPLGLGIADWHAELEPAGETTVVFRDSAFADDVAKTNLTAILEQRGLGNVRSL